MICADWKQKAAQTHRLTVGCSVSSGYFVTYNASNFGKGEAVELLAYKAQALFRYHARCRVISLRRILALELGRI